MVKGNPKALLDLWETLSHKVLACVLVDDGAVFPVLDIVKDNAGLFAPRTRPVWRAVLQCVETNTPPTTETISARVNGADPGYVQTIAALFNEDDNLKLRYNTEELKGLGIWARARQIGQQLAEVESPDKMDAAITEANTELAGLYATKNDRDASAEAVDDIAWGEIENFTDRPVPTGLKWFDKLSHGGFWRGMNYWLAAPYKSGKSTIMRNLILYAAQMGIPVSAYCAEGKREMFALDCQAMLATKVLIDFYGTGDDSRFRLSGLFIKNNWQHHQDDPVFTKDEYEAIQIGRQEWRRLPIRTYDTRDGIRDLTTLQYDIKRDKMKYGSEVIWLDYSQLFGSSSTLFEQQRATALRLQQIAQDENVVLAIIAQKNEEGIKDSNGYSPKIKGGGDAAAAADGVLVSEINQEHPGYLKIELKLSRHTATGKGMHKIETNSGLMLKELSVDRTVSN
jgi:hypothetical protein